MAKVIVIGAGVVGAAIAYELTALANVDVTLIDGQKPAQGATGAALGILMGAISQKRRVAIGDYVIKVCSGLKPYYQN